MSSFQSPSDALRAEIAAAAARMIAEDGASYGMAKRKAAEQILGEGNIRGDFMPDNAQVEDEVRAYQQLFMADTQPARLLHLRKLALEWMVKLSDFSPYLTGAVLNGTAGEHSDIHLQLFCDNPKDVEIFLLNLGVSFDVSESPHFRRADRQVETLSFLWKGEGIHLSLYGSRDMRGALKAADGRIERADAQAVSRLMTENKGEQPDEA